MGKASQPIVGAIGHAEGLFSCNDYANSDVITRTNYTMLSAAIQGGGGHYFFGLRCMIAARP